MSRQLTHVVGAIYEAPMKYHDLKIDKAALNPERSQPVAALGHSLKALTEKKIVRVKE